MRNRFVPKIIPATICMVDQLVMEDLPQILETLGTRQTVLPKESVTDTAHSGAHIYQTPREASRTHRDGSTPQHVNTVVMNERLIPPSPSFTSTSNSPTRNRNQDIVSPRRSIITTEARKSDPLVTPINQISAVHGHYTSTFSRVIGH